MNGRLGGLHSRSGDLGGKNILSLQGNGPRTVQPSLARYTDCPILAPFYMTPIYILKFSFEMTCRIFVYDSFSSIADIYIQLDRVPKLSVPLTKKGPLCRCPREWIVIRHMSQNSDMQ